MFKIKKYYTNIRQKVCQTQALTGHHTLSACTSPPKAKAQAPQICPYFCTQTHGTTQTTLLIVLRHAGWLSKGQGPTSQGLASTGRAEERARSGQSPKHRCFESKPLLSCIQVMKKKKAVRLKGLKWQP